MSAKPQSHFEEKISRANFLEDLWQLGVITSEDEAAEIYEKWVMNMKDHAFSD